MLKAKSEIFFDNHRYLPGDVLPEDTAMKSLWLESGAPYESDGKEEKKVKANRAADKAGLPGKAVSNTETDENLVGIVPKSEARKKK